MYTATISRPNQPVEQLRLEAATRDEASLEIAERAAELPNGGSIYAFEHGAPFEAFHRDASGKASMSIYGK